MAVEGRRDWREVRVWEAQDVFLRFPAAQNLVLSVISTVSSSETFGLVEDDGEGKREIVTRIQQLIVTLFIDVSLESSCEFLVGWMDGWESGK
jgi:hypothetical protein